ncbi:MAG: cation diffusion facilitator family transporter [Bacteroidota bacterium]|nr:cation diffusion facilitator family transporter [Bacteroidota bacterium]
MGLKASRENLRLQKIITFIAILLFIIKGVAAIITGSLAILTDALESIVNVVAGALGLYSLYVSSKPKDADHPYGHGKVEFISAAVEGSLIILAGFFIIYNAIVHIIYPHSIAKLDLGILLISITAIINYIAGTVCVSTGKRNNSLQLIAAGRHLKTDTYSTLGIVAGLSLIHITKLEFIDSIIAGIVAIIIILTGYKIARTSIAGIMDEADTQLLNDIVTLLNKNRPENWIDLHNLRIIKYGSTLHCDCHLTVPWYLNVYEAHAEIDALAQLIRNKFGESLELFVHSDGCQEYSCKICAKKNCLVRKHPFEKRIHWTINNISKDSKHSILIEKEINQNQVLF